MVSGGTGVDTLVMWGSDPSVLSVWLNNDGTGMATNDVGSVQLEGIENVTIVAPPFGSSEQPNVSLRGNNLANVLQTAGGSDVLDGGDGSDTLIGGGDADLFVFDHLGPTSGDQHDVIVDFQSGVDHIDLIATGVQDYADLLSGDDYMHDTSLGIIIHTSVDAGTSILLQNVHSVTAADFYFLSA